MLIEIKYASAAQNPENPQDVAASILTHLQFVAEDPFHSAIRGVVLHLVRGHEDANRFGKSII